MPPVHADPSACLAQSVGALRFENASRVARGHLVDLAVADAAGFQGRQHVFGYVPEMPVGEHRAQCGVDDVLGREVDVAAGVVAEHHLVSVSPARELDDGLDPGVCVEGLVDAEAVHADEAALGQHALDVVEVVAVAGMSDDDTAEIDAFVFEDMLLCGPGVGGGVGVRRDGQARGPVSLGGRAQQFFVDRRDAIVVGGAFDDARSCRRALNALLDVADELIQKFIVTVMCINNQKLNILESTVQGGKFWHKVNIVQHLMFLL